MDKQKMNLEQLYQERFQSFEMEPSSESSALMKSKMKKAKTIQTMKWVASIIVTAVVIATVAYFSLKSNNESTQVKQENIENTKIENLNNKNKTPNTIAQSTQETPNTPSTQKTQTNKQQNAIKNQDALDDKIQKSELSSSKLSEDTEQVAGSYQKQNKDDPNILGSSKAKTNTTSSKSKEDRISSQKEEQQTGNQIVNSSGTGESNNMTFNSNGSIIIDNQKANSDAEALSKSSRNIEPYEKNFSHLRYLDSKKSNIPNSAEEVDLEKKSAKLLSRTWLGASKRKSRKSSYQSGPFKKPDQKRGKLDGYFDLHFSPMMWNNQANWDSPSLDTSWTYSLQNNPQLSYEFGFSFQLHHQDLPLFMQIGLDYQILKEKVEYNFTRRFEDPNLSYWDYDSLWHIEDVLDTFYIIVDSNQFVIDSIYTQDTLLTGIDSSYNAVISKEEKNKSNVNIYRYLNIPLLLGYEFSSRNKNWNFQILGGAAIAINLKNEGYYYTSTGDFASYSGKVNPQLVWNLYAAANVNYRWKKWQLFAQPEFQYQLNESELSDGIPRRKYQFYKLKFGIRYQLF